MSMPEDAVYGSQRSYPTAPETKPIGRLDEICTNLRQFVNIASMIRHSLKDDADRVFGPLPEEVKSDKNPTNANTNCTLNEIMCNIAFLERELLDMQEQAQRFNKL